MKGTESLQVPIAGCRKREYSTSNISWVPVEVVVLHARESLCGAIRLEVFLYEAEFNGLGSRGVACITNHLGQGVGL